MSTEKNIRIKHRVDIKENWENENPVLLENEIGFEKDTGQYKIGTGKGVAWNNLPYASVGIYNESSAEIFNSSNYMLIDEKQNNIATGEYSHAEGRTTIANGDYSHSEGINTIVEGRGSHAEGDNTKAKGAASHTEGAFVEAIGDVSHAEGVYTTASGYASHAEGAKTIATGDFSCATGRYGQAIGFASHVEGNSTIATGEASHAEGNQTKAIGDYSHAEGLQTIANGKYSHSEGYYTQANGEGAHTEGIETKVDGNFSHANGYYNNVEGNYSYVEGAQNNVFGDYSHASGRSNTIKGNYSYAEGINNTVEGNHLHAEGDLNTVSGDCSHAEGYQNTISGKYSHAEGLGTKSYYYSHSEGYKTLASNTGHAEGSYTQATGAAHAEGDSSIASGSAAHAEGYNTYAIIQSHSEGNNTRATGNYAHAEGSYTKAQHNASHAEGVNSSANGEASHAEGNSTITEGDAAHAEGYGTYAGLRGFKYSVINDMPISSFDNKLITLQLSYNSYMTDKFNLPDWEVGDYIILRRDYDLNFDYYNSAKVYWLNCLITNIYCNFIQIDTSEYSFFSEVDGSLNGFIFNKDRPNKGYVSLFQATHAEGYKNQALGQGSHAEGVKTKAFGYASHSAGYHTSALGNIQTVIGKYNIEDQDSLFIIGNGIENEQANALRVDKNSNLIIGSNNDASGAKSGLIVGNNNRSIWVGSEEFCFMAGEGLQNDSYTPIILGRYNETWQGNSNWPLMIVGNGSQKNPSNAMVLDIEGNMSLSGKLQDDSIYKVGDILNTYRTNLNDNWLLCDGLSTTSVDIKYKNEFSSFNKNILSNSNILEYAYDGTYFYVLKASDFVLYVYNNINDCINLTNNYVAKALGSDALLYMASRFLITDLGKYEYKLQDYTYNQKGQVSFRVDLEHKRLNIFITNFSLSNDNFTSIRRTSVICHYSLYGTEEEWHGSTLWSTSAVVNSSSKFINNSEIIYSFYSQYSSNSFDFTKYSFTDFSTQNFTFSLATSTNFYIYNCDIIPNFGDDKNLWLIRYDKYIYSLDSSLTNFVNYQLPESSTIVYLLANSVLYYLNKSNQYCALTINSTLENTSLELRTDLNGAFYRISYDYEWELANSATLQDGIYHTTKSESLKNLTVYENKPFIVISNVGILYTDKLMITSQLYTGLGKCYVRIK